MGRGIWAVIAVFAALGAGCTSDGADEVVAAPSVLADAADGIDSGRMEVLGDDGASGAVWQFDGDDQRMVFDPGSFGAGVGDDQVPDDLVPDDMEWPVEVLTVDGVTYDRTEGSERWTRYEDEVWGPSVSDGFSDFLAAASEVVVERPGERTERDGVEVTRYTGTLDDAEAERLLWSDVDDGTDSGTPDDTPVGAPDAYSEDWGDPFAEEWDAVYERGERINEYFRDRTTVEFVGEIDTSGRLVRLEVGISVDTSEYPDCEAYTGVGVDRMVLTELGEPQDIVAPPADLVDEEPQYGVDDPMVEADPSFEEAIPEDEPMLGTASGERPTWAVLEYLRASAERQGIDWRSMPLPDEAQMVTLFDQFYAQDLAERGPAVDTMWGPYPRGFLVEVVVANADWLGIDGAGVDALSDAELVRWFEESGGIGTGSDPALEVPAEEWPVEGPPDEELGGANGSAEVQAAMEEMYQGCPA